MTTIEQELHAERAAREALGKLRDAVERVIISFDPGSPLRTAALYSEHVGEAEATARLALATWTHLVGR